MLSGHQDGNHHMGDIGVGEGHAVLVCTASEGRDHVVLILAGQTSPFFISLRRGEEASSRHSSITHRNSLTSPPLLYDPLVKLAHLLLRPVPLHIGR